MGRFKPEAREKILAFMEVQVTSIKHRTKRNGAKTLSTGDRVIQNQVQRQVTFN
jgi:hypothetical protein